MTTPIIIGSIATAKVIQLAFLSLVVRKVGKSKRFKRKEVVQSWSLTKFLEESR